MTKGLYSMDDLESLKLDIFYNSIRSAISSNFIRRTMSISTDRQGINYFYQLPTEKLEKTWGEFHLIGEIVMGFRGIYVVYVLINQAFTFIIELESWFLKLQKPIANFFLTHNRFKI